MTEQTRQLPEYNKPPVEEVVVGVQFESLEHYTTVHPGLYWQTIKKDYPHTEDQLPLELAYELFNEDKGQGITHTLKNMLPLRRCWFVNEGKNSLVQVQPERFLHNWRKISGKEEYPRYENIRQEFRKLWQGFRRFVKKWNLGELKLNYWELTYVNHIAEGEVWTSMGDISRVLPLWSGSTSGSYLPKPENIKFDVKYAFSNELTRLHVKLEPRIRRLDSSKLLRLTLTARGRLQSETEKKLLEKLDFGHELIVQAFTDITSPDAHKIWKRK